MTELRIETSKPAPSPVINAWLNPTPKGFELVMQHSDDASDQRLFFFDLRDGKIEISMQEIAASKLCDALGVERRSTPPIISWATKETLLPSLPDKLPSGVAEALGPEPVVWDWADKLVRELWPLMGDIAASEKAKVLRSRCRPIGNDTVTDARTAKIVRLATNAVDLGHCYQSQGQALDALREALEATQ